jgi:hypothetical protein
MVAEEGGELYKRAIQELYKRSTGPYRSSIHELPLLLLLSSSAAIRGECIMHQYCICTAGSRPYVLPAAGHHLDV